MVAVTGLLLLLLLFAPANLGHGEEDACDNSDDNEFSEYINADLVDNHKAETIPGKKDGSVWLVVDDEFICIKNDISESGTVVWWECRYRRNQGCPFKMTTRIEDEEDESGVPKLDGRHSIIDMMDPNMHTCGQRMEDVLNDKFKGVLKNKMCNAIKANWQTTYNMTRLDFANSITDPASREFFLQSCPTAYSYRSSANRARTKMLPVAPKSYHDVDFSRMGGNTNYSEYVLAQVSSRTRLRKYIHQGIVKQR